MTVGRILRMVRIVVSVVVFAATVAALTSGAGAVLALTGWTGAIQIVPLLMAGSLSGVGLWLTVTLVMGRIYCSTACPLGTLMDCSTAAMRWSRRGFDFRYARPLDRTRGAFFAIAVAAAITGFTAVVGLLDPYAAFVRILTPLIGREMAIDKAETILTATWVAVPVAVVIFAAVVAVGWKRGRLVCNTVCPVGTALGGVARFAMLQFDIDTDRCTHCRRCEHVCKAQCIDMASHTVDASRCVVCFDCVDACHDGAIRWTSSRKRLSTPLMQRISPAPSASIAKPETSEG